MADENPQGGATATQGGDDSSTIREMRRQLDEAAAREKARDAEIASIRRDAMFDKLGIKPDGVGKLFRDKYDGELTEEAVKTAATDYGVLTPPRATGDEEREIVQRLRDTGGAVPLDTEPKFASEHLDKIRTDAEFDDNDKLMAYVRNLGLVKDD